MNFLEKDLEEIIYKADKVELSKRGLNIKGKLYRQLRIGNYGIADLVEVKRIPAVFCERNGKNELISEGKIHVNVLELKKETINVSAFLQTLGYLKGITNFLYERNISVVCNISLIGKSIDLNSLFCYLPEFIYNSDGDNFITNYTYNYNIDGISFKEEIGFKLTNEGF